jgi:hypothetical protein
LYTTNTNSSRLFILKRYRGYIVYDDILRVVNGAVSSVGVSAGLRFPGGNIPVVVDGTRVCALFFGTVRA